MGFASGVMTSEVEVNPGLVPCLPECCGHFLCCHLVAVAGTSRLQGLLPGRRSSLEKLLLEQQALLRSEQGQEVAGGHCVPLLAHSPDVCKGQGWAGQSWTLGTQPRLST